MIKIFLSPANHYKNYAIEGRSEKEQMDMLAPLLKAELEKYEGVKAYITKVYADTRQYDGRPEEARDIGVDLYFAMHTNASGMSATGGTATGACGFYHPDYPESKAIAEAVVRELNSICPIKSNRAMQPAIYGWNREYCNLGELRVPARYGMPPVLIEHEFHDRYEGAKWIVENLPAIAAADARGIAKVLGLKKKREMVRGDVNGDGEADNLDAAMILQYDAGLRDFTEAQKSAADVNNDGMADNLDATEILRQDAGVKTQELKEQNTATKSTHKIGDKVYFCGGYQYSTSTSAKPAGKKCGAGNVRIYSIAPNAKHKYSVFHCDNAATTVCGWVDSDTIKNID